MKIISIRFVTMIMLLSITSLSYAQAQPQMQQMNMSPSGKLSGFLFDSITTAPIEYGNIVVHNLRDSSLITGTISNPSGKFAFDKLPFGRMFVKISYMGYETKFIDTILITPRTPEIDLRQIDLVPSALNIGEVLIAADKDLMVNNLDKKVINVEKNITSQGGTAADVMQNIPSVTVDADGSVSLRGNKNVTILIDGRPNGLASLGSADLLNNIPASSIESIELVTNPSAKYDPEGTAGIINIVLKKKTDIGLNGVLSINAGTRDKYTTSINLNLRQSPFNLFASYDGRIANNSGTGNTNRLTNFSGVSSSLIQNQIDKNLMQSHNANAGFDYSMNDFNTLTFSFQFRRFGMEINSNVSNNSFDASNVLQRDFTRLTAGDRAVSFRNYTLSYKKTYGVKGQEFTTDFMFNDINMNFNQNSTQNEFTIGSPLSGSSTLQRTTSRNLNKIYILQSNYKHPFPNLGTLETGYKSTLRNLYMKSDYDVYNNSLISWINDPLSKNYFRHNELIHAVYATFAGTVTGIKYQAGLRAEKTYTEGTQQGTNISSTKDYLSFYPSLHLVQEFGNEQEVLLSYSRRVNRPHPRQINPVIDYTDSLNISQGNPFLDPEFVNSYELGYSQYWGPSSFTSNVFYKMTDGLIGSFSALEANGVTRTTFRNLSEGTSYGVEFTGSHALLPWWKMNANASYFKTEITGPDFNNESFSWLAKLNSTMTVWENIMVQLMLNYNSPTVISQSKMKEMFFADLALRKEFWGGKISLLLRVTDIFNTQKFDVETIGTGFISTNFRKRDSQNIYLGITYRLDATQKMRERNPRTDASMEEY